MHRSKYELRCFCAHHPLLAVYGLNERGKLYVHIKVFKQDRLYAEVVAEGGPIRLHCRDCLRWHTVKIVQPGRAELKEEIVPPRIPARR